MRISQDPRAQELLERPVVTTTDLEGLLSTPLIDELGIDFAERRVMDVYERVAPSVVNITTQVLTRTFFFDVVPEEGAGSGFVIDRDGHILTNYHVIENANRVEVTFSDDTVLPATFVGADPQNDIALIKVDTESSLLSPVEFGRSSDLVVGQRAIAIGNPFGQFGQTLTTGVISAVNRTLAGPEGREMPGVIQTDAAINRGNSGGPLLDSSGQVIGVNTAIFSPSGTSSGVGFAIPIDTVNRVLPDLLEFGHYRRPWLGIRSVHTLNARLAEALNLEVAQGLLLVQLFRDAPLDRAGAQGARREVIIGNRRLYAGGDILRAIDGEPIIDLDGVSRLLETNYQIGDRVRVSLIRGSDPIELVVTLGTSPER